MNHSIVTLNAILAQQIPSTPGIDLAPPPVDLQVNHTAGQVFLVAGLASFIATAIAAVVISRRHRNLIVPMLMLGGVLFAFVEPIPDMISGVWYPGDIPFQAANVFGRDVSWTIAMAYTFFFAATGYGGYLLIKRGVSLRILLGYAALFSLIDSVAEMGGSQFDVFQWYAYDGPNPAAILGLPVYMIAYNGLYAVLSGAALFYAEPYLRGWRVLLVIPGVTVVYIGPPLVLTAPSIWALNNPVSDAVMWLTCAVSTALVLIVAVHVAKLPRIAALRSSASVPASKPTAGVAVSA